MIIGYARVSREDKQNPVYQHSALTAAGCERIFEDHISGTKWVRQSLDAALGAVSDGDTLIVWKLDRLGRSFFEIIRTVHELNARGVFVRSLTQSFDTSTAIGKAILGFYAAIAEDELVNLKARMSAGMRAAQRRGKHIGRPITMTPEKRDMAERLLFEGRGRAETARMVGVSPATLRRHLNAGAS
jgi:DNA invertase Pin-like site-specific DNA recombinase